MSVKVQIVDYDPRWPALFSKHAERVREALGSSALRIEHTGSTSVPGLAAKPVIDIVLIVHDSAREEQYAPPLESSGYLLEIREPDWHQHRMFKGPKDAVNLHVLA